MQAIYYPTHFNHLKYLTQDNAIGNLAVVLKFSSWYLLNVWQKEGKVYLYIKAGFGTSFNKHNVELPRLRFPFLRGDLPAESCKEY
jgi:hypothetical protein